MRYRLAIFDFDGTLADSFPWFSGVLNQVADRYRFRRVEEHEVERLRALGAREIIKDLRLSWWKLPFVAAHMRTLAARDAASIPLFAGVSPMLSQLHAAGVTLAIVSSNAEDTVRRALGRESAALIHHYGCGASMFGKPAKLRGAIKSCGVPATAAIAIGDEIRDYEAAREAGLAFGAVTWGFTTAAALRALPLATVFEHPEEIVRLLAHVPR